MAGCCDSYRRRVPAHPALIRRRAAVKQGDEAPCAFARSLTAYYFECLWLKTGNSVKGGSVRLGTLCSILDEFRFFYISFPFFLQGSVCLPLVGHLP